MNEQLRFYSDDDAQTYALARAQGKTHEEADNAARAERRKDARRQLSSHCLSCHAIALPFRADGELRCRSCGSTRVSVHRRFVVPEFEMPAPNDEANLTNDLLAQRAFDRAVKVLHGRERQVVDAIAGRDGGPCLICTERCKGGIPNGECDNYSERIAAWLGISACAVAQYRRRAILKLARIVRTRGHL